MAKIERKVKKSWYDKVKGILLTGTSHMLPVVVIGGFLQAIAKLILESLSL